MMKKILELEKQNDIKIIYLGLSGSHLHGTSTPASDLDISGIFVSNTGNVLLKQDKDEINLNSNTKTKNTNEDYDIKLWSHYKFLDLLSKGDTNAMGMLFSSFNPDMVKYKTPGMSKIQKKYKSLINKKIKGYLGYAYSMSQKYGTKGTKLKEIKEFLVFLEAHKGKIINEIWKEYLDFVMNKKYLGFSQERRINGNRFIDVLDKQYQDTKTVENVINHSKAIVKKYGARAQSASSGVDWKSLSHSLRAIYEAKELLSTKFVKYPLKDAKYLTDVKQGNIELQDVVQKIELGMTEVDDLFITSTLNNESNDNTIKDLKLSLLWEDIELHC